MEDEKKNQEKSEIPEGTPEQGEDRLKKCETERDEYLNGWKRAKADLINYKKEELTRLERFIQLSNEEILKQVIEVIDSFDLALRGKSGEEEKGMRIIQGQLEAMLRRNSVDPIKAFGEAFNPSLHEAIEEVASEKPQGVIIEEVSRGWKWRDRVIRPSRVKISKGTP